MHYIVCVFIDSPLCVFFSGSGGDAGGFMQGGGSQNNASPGAKKVN